MSIGVSISGSSVGLDVPIPDVPGLSVDVSYNIANNTFSAGISEGCGIASVFIGAANIQDVNGQLVGALPPPPPSPAPQS
jgi:hypothetical protein